MKALHSIFILSQKIISMLCLSLGIFGSTNLAAQAWPDKPIKIIVPFAAGGSADILGRILA
jgi:tripartite-type tricarboxylate transporter receptor subunit TctC